MRCGSGHDGGSGIRAATRWLALGLAVLVLPWRTAAWAQTPPAGNQHPPARVVEAHARAMPNPFGPPQRGPASAALQKHAFAEALAAQGTLAVLRTLAVQHDGRVKILDTLARETVLRLTGRPAFDEPAPSAAQTGGSEGSSAFRRRTLRYDPLFTFLDLLIDPGYYLERPLVHVDYLPLRQELVRAHWPDDPAQQEQWLRLGRLPPLVIARWADTMRARHQFHEPYRRALDRTEMALEIFDFSAANLLLVAPAARDRPYAHLGSLPEGHPARQAAADLGRAWRQRDAAGVHAAAVALARELPAINPAVYPTWRRDLEHLYNRARAFEWGLWLYAGAFVALVLAFGTHWRWLIALGVALLLSAIAAHAFGFVTRCILAERFAIQNQFESMTGVSLFAALVGTIIMLGKRQWLYGAAAAGVGFLVLITATQTAIPGKFIEREAAILNTSVLLKYHVTTVLCSYGLIALGFIISLFYLGVYYTVGRHIGPAPAGPGAMSSAVPPALAAAAAALNLPSHLPPGPRRLLHDLDQAQTTVLQLAFWTLGVGILLGAWWADHSWGRWWAFDPKETWALATWIIYLIVVHLRFAVGPRRGLVTAWLSILGFLMMLWTYFGVNLLLPGLHAYA